jgi:nucleotide-binding universal stress UspA family protein
MSTMGRGARSPRKGQPPSPGAVYRRILVATDGSESAGRAVQVAVEQAKASGGSILAVCVARVSEYATLEADALDGHAKERCEVALTSAKRVAKAAGVDLKVELLAGHPADRILAVIERESPDLVVVGTRSLSRSRRFLLGSVSNALLHHAKCAVLVVR